MAPECGAESLVSIYKTFLIQLEPILFILKEVEKNLAYIGIQ